ncbi:hypothetical protein CDG81_12200 [Actinopolyspora erythraea]|uniref:3-octaprenyl-4-hydroxybenzoate carboxy-lyase-like Rift-related domain-containing protein n=1 Tax=Actinopolyspora erythraea TaxID=414996 RepID=A0A223RSR9_9ACTN|nr:UbiD family decarboxylase [Actinopolyspora erythraea]ASU78918.1 hypothetical protein CDG81_12200 [Actinopolyspora erythraea]
MSAEAPSLRLPGFYRATEVRVHDTPLSPIVELTRWTAEEERRLGRRPTVLFSEVVGHPDAAVLVNPCPKPVLLEAMGLDGAHWAEQLEHRLRAPGPGVLTRRREWKTLSGLDALPVPQHRPGDAGRYITAGVGITRSPEGEVNLGVYRVQVVDSHRARIFFDPRTDAHRNWSRHLEAGESMDVTVFIGASPVHLLAGASRLTEGGSDFEVAARLAGEQLVLDDRFGVPVDAQYVLTGRVGGTLETEGPFAEFKGYYVPARESPVLEVTEVASAESPYYPTIVTGAESGLTLMSLQNEYLMYAHLVERGFPVESVVYPHAARAEFLAVVVSPEPCEELLRAAMDFDVRSKMVVCAPEAEDFWQMVAVYGFSVEKHTYYRKGVEYGDRVGFVFDRKPDGWPVEF